MNHRRYTRHADRCNCSGCKVFWGLTDFVVRVANEYQIRKTLPDPVMRSKTFQEILDSRTGDEPFIWGEA